MRRRKVHFRGIVTKAGRVLNVTVEGDIVTLREHRRRYSYTTTLSSIIGKAFLDCAMAEALRIRAERKARRKRAN